jgi:hypothetical protein
MTTLIVTLTGLPSDGFEGFENRSNIRIAKQVKKEPVDMRAVESPAHTLEFSADVRPHKATSEPDFFGPEVFGAPDRRFLYVQWFEMANGVDESFRRLKVDLSGITWEMIESAKPLKLQVNGTQKDGSPACATAARLDPGWHV